MPSANRFASSLATILIGVAASTLAWTWPWSPARATGSARAEIYRMKGFPVGKTREMPVFDPRWSNGKLFYSVIDTDKVMVEGDLVLGTEEEVLRQSLSNAVIAATEAVGQNALMKALPSNQARSEVQRLAGLGPGALRVGDRAKLEAEVERAVKAMAPLQGLRPVGAANGDVQRQAAGVFAGASCQFRWPNGVIPYEVVAVPDENLLDEAIKDWERRTDGVIRFVKRDAKNAAMYPDYVRFEAGIDDCYAYSLGRKPGQGMHRVTLAGGCGKIQIIHEIGHIVGLFHEHCRTDRDKWIEIDTSNMIDDAKCQFAKIDWKEGENLTPFDFKSVMMYPFKAFAKDTKGAPTIVIRKDVRAATGGPVTIPKDPAAFGLDTGDFGGKTDDLSDLDVEGVKKMYQDKPCGPGRP